MARVNVGVIFGGKAPEHEVSIITGIQVMNNLSREKYNVYPIYVTKKGEWFLGDKSFYKPETFKNQKSAVKDKPRVVLAQNALVGLIKIGKRLTIPSFEKTHIDVFFPTFHGRYGEDGSIQGVLEMSDIPYVGCDVQASSIGMNKIISKMIAKSIGIPVLKSISLKKSAWQKSKSRTLNKHKGHLKFPIFVKPVRLGSSIGISKTKNVEELEKAIAVAFFYDNEVMLEESLENSKEINISILGNNPYEVSALEQPISRKEILSFEDKYIPKDGNFSKGMATAKRIVPAVLKKSTEVKIKNYAIKFFSEISGSGMARIDFLLSKDEKQVYFNEINTLPGSMAFYLWRAKGLSFNKLTERLINLAFDKKNKEEKLITTFKSNILEGYNKQKGIKK